MRELYQHSEPPVDPDVPVEGGYGLLKELFERILEYGGLDEEDFRPIPTDQREQDS